MPRVSFPFPRDRSPHNRCQDFWAIGALAITILILFWKLILLGHVPVDGQQLAQFSPWGTPHLFNPAVISDNISQLYPFRIYTALSLRHGRIPLWNPYLFAGTPYLANNQSAVFDPFGLVLILSPTPLGFGIMLLLHLFTAGLLMYLFLATNKLSPPAALLGAIAFSLSNYFVLSLKAVSFTASGLWIPLLFLLLHRLRQTGQVRYAAWCAFPIALLFLGGMGQLALYVLPAACLYYFIGTPIQTPQPSATPLQRSALLLGLTCALGVSLAAIQLLPLAEALPLSERQHDIARYSTLNNFPPHYLLATLVPTVFTPLLPNHFIPYVGMLPLLFAGLALLTSHTRETRFFLYLSISPIALLVALNIPQLYRLVVSLVPSFDRFEHARSLLLVTFALATLAAYGLDKLLAVQDPSTLRPACRQLTGIASAGLLLFLAVTILANFARRSLVALATTVYRTRFDAEPIYYWHRLDLLFQRFTPVHRDVLLACLIGGAGLTMVWLLATRRLPRPLVLTFLVGGAATELLAFGLQHITFAPSHLVYPPTTATSFLQRDPELFRIGSVDSLVSVASNEETPLLLDTNMPYRLQSITGYDSISLHTYITYLKLVEHNSNIEPSSLTHYNSPLLNLANMKYILTHRTISSPHLQLVFTRGMNIYRNRRMLPRAFIVPTTQVLAQEALMHATLQSPRFDPRTTVLLQEDPTGAPIGGGSGEARVLAYQAEEVSIHASVSDGGGWLVLSDAFYPGWKATVDGHDVTIYQADLAFRAIPLTPGNHLIHFLYRPLSFRLGAWISLVTLLAITVLLCTSSRRTL